MKAHEIRKQKKAALQHFTSPDPYPMYVVFQNRVMRVQGPGESPEISQELQFEYITSDHEVVDEYKEFKRLKELN